MSFLFSISIHAPVKGATPFNDIVKVHADISIHAPVKGATRLLRRLVIRRRWNFNPRTREGCDRESQRNRLRLPCISIHAPVKGATFASQVLIIICCDFNPRTREGCDGNRRRPFVFVISISIHAPVKGATMRYLRILQFCEISIHAPVKGATMTKTSTIAVLPTFQSTHP